MFKKLTIMALAAGLVFEPLPARAAILLYSTFAQQVEETGGGLEIAALDKEKPAKREKGGKEEKTTDREKEAEGKKKYDDFRDKNGNGIDDRFEKKEPSRKKKKPGEAEVNF
ncbi:MAG TPA: hypothetical protein VNL73_10040 [Verrucomicrobiae bacterium]|nr:hypothetical protein [Verrucomicrobiae bacterium]